MRLKKQIAILALGAGFAACTPQPATNLIEDNWSLHSNSSGLLLMR